MELINFSKRIDETLNKISNRLNQFEERLNDIEQRLNVIKPDERPNMVVVYHRPRENYRGFLLTEDDYQIIIGKNSNDISEFYDMFCARSTDTCDFSTFRDLIEAYKIDNKITKWCHYSYLENRLKEFATSDEALESF